MASNKKCSLCKAPIDKHFCIRWKSYICIPCHEVDKELRKVLIASMKDGVEELIPMDDRYQFGVLASTESRARAIVEQHYYHTPSGEDREC